MSVSAATMTAALVGALELLKFLKACGAEIDFSNLEKAITDKRAEIKLKNDLIQKT
jgi:hypothetical protein